jgi:Lrp/AsnC family leucine-responsive transcriptional regulator
MDSIDRTILDSLQKDARVPNTQIAKQIGMVPSGTAERIRKLEESGVIEGYQTRVNPRSVGLPLLAFVFVKADERIGAPDTGLRLSAIPQVLEVHHVAGEDCYLAKVRAADTEHLGRLLREQFGTIETVRSTRTTIVLESLKESTALPLPAVVAAPRGNAKGGAA